MTENTLLALATVPADQLHDGLQAVLPHVATKGVPKWTQFVMVRVTNSNVKLVASDRYTLAEYTLDLVPDHPTVEGFFHLYKSDVRDLVKTARQSRRFVYTGNHPTIQVQRQELPDGSPYKAVSVSCLDQVWIGTAASNMEEFNYESLFERHSEQEAVPYIGVGGEHLAKFAKIGGMRFTFHGLSGKAILVEGLNDERFRGLLMPIRIAT